MPTVTSRTGCLDSVGTVSIRPATLADTSDIYTIEQNSFKTDGFHLRQFRHALTRGHGFLLIAKEGATPTGYIWVLLHKGRPHMARIYSIAVSPQHQGKGIAAKLLAATLAELQKRGIRDVRLEVREDNAHAQQFYSNKGFATFATAPNYYADGTAALKMCLQLNAKD